MLSLLSDEARWRFRRADISLRRPSPACPFLGGGPVLAGLRDPFRHTSRTNNRAPARAFSFNGLGLDMLFVAITHSGLGAPPRPVLYCHHVAHLCGISTRMVRYAAERGARRGYRDPFQPRAWRFLRDDVEEFRARRAAK